MKRKEGILFILLALVVLGAGCTDKEQNEEFVNAATEVAADALILSMDSLMESWILDSKASFHSIS